MRLTTEKKIIATVVILTAVALAIIGLIIAPLLYSIQTTDTQIFSLRQFLERRYEQAITSNNSIKEIKTIKAETDAFPDHLLTPARELHFVTLLEELAAQNGVQQKIVSSNVDDTNAPSLTFNISITGSYEKTIAFLRDLEAAPYFVTIDTLSFAATTDPGNPAARLTTLTLALHLYVTR